MRTGRPAVQGTRQGNVSPLQAVWWLCVTIRKCSCVKMSGNILSSVPWIHCTHLCISSLHWLILEERMRWSLSVYVCQLVCPFLTVCVSVSVCQSVCVSACLVVCCLLYVPGLCTALARKRTSSFPVCLYTIIPYQCAEGDTLCVAHCLTGHKSHKTGGGGLR